MPENSNMINSGADAAVGSADAAATAGLARMTSL